MSRIYDDLIIPYVGPGFCCSVSCIFEKEDTYDSKFNLHHFMDFASNEKWKCFAKNCPIHWSEPFHCQGDIRCVQFPKFCEYFNIPSNSEPKKAARSNISESKKMFEPGII